MLLHSYRTFSGLELFNETFVQMVDRISEGLSLSIQISASWFTQLRGCKRSHFLYKLSHQKSHVGCSGNWWKKIPYLPLNHLDIFHEPSGFLILGCCYHHPVTPYLPIVDGLSAFGLHCFAWLCSSLSWMLWKPALWFWTFHCPCLAAKRVPGWAHNFHTNVSYKGKINTLYMCVEWDC